MPPGIRTVEYREFLTPEGRQQQGAVAVFQQIRKSHACAKLSLYSPDFSVHPAA